MKEREMEVKCLLQKFHIVFIYESDRPS